MSQKLLLSRSGRDPGCLSQLLAGPTDDLCRALQGKRRHYRSDDDIRPAGTNAEHAKRSQRHGNVAEGIIA